MSDSTPKCGWNEAAPNIDAACKTIKLVCIGCGKETAIEGGLLDRLPPPMVDRLVAFYSQCPACELKLKGWPVTINDQ